jgi:hypothetical protein
LSVLRNCTYDAGSWASHLTSAGGFLFESVGHMSILRWLEAGAAGSYGTVVEPYALTNKFTDPRIHYWYGRGFTLGESVYMSVQNPYQGVVVGDLLCAPYAVPASVAISGLTNGQYVSGVMTVSVNGVAADASKPVDRLELYRDGLYMTSLTNVMPASGNIVAVTLNGDSRSYTVEPGDSIYDVAAGLAGRIDGPPPQAFTAVAYGDRIELKQKTAGQAAGGTNICLVGVSQGSADELTMGARTVFTNFLESEARAYKQISFSGRAASGDVVRAVITTLTGKSVTNDYVCAGTNLTGYTLLTNLTAIVNSEPALQGNDGCEMKWAFRPDPYGDTSVGEAHLVARTNGWAGYNLYASITAIQQPGSSLTNSTESGLFNGNEVDLTARAEIFISAGRSNLTVHYVVDTTAWPDGPHDLLAVAREGTAVGTQGHDEKRVIIRNTDLECRITNLSEVSYAVLGQTVPVQVQAWNPESVITGIAFYAEGKWVGQQATSTAEFSIDTGDYGIGILHLYAEAFDDVGKSVWSDAVELHVAPSNWITAATAGHGSVSPSGAVLVAQGDQVAINILPDSYYHSASVRVDGVWRAATNQVRFPVVTNDHGVLAVFAPNTGPREIPHWWLAEYGLGTNDETVWQDADGDSWLNWEEYYTDTSPSNPSAFLLPLTVGWLSTNLVVHVQPSSTGRLYEMEACEDLASIPAVWTVQCVKTGEGSAVDLPVSNQETQRIFRLKIRVP